MKSKWIPLAAVVFLFVCRHAPAAPAAPLADRVPGDALVYLGWSGADHAPGYDGSHLKAVVDASEIDRLIDQVIPAVLAKLGENRAETGKVTAQITEITRTMWHHPAALYFGGIELNGPAVPRLAILCDAGSDAPAMAERITALLDKARKELPGGSPAFTVRQYGSLVVAAFGTDSAVDDQFEKPPADSLDKSADFRDAMKQVNPRPVMVGYVNAGALVAAMDDSVGKLADDRIVERWKAARASLGLGQFKRILITGGFDGADWVDEQLVTTTGTDGLAGLFAVKPLDPALLAVVPKTADRMGAFQLDLGNVLNQFRRVVGANSPGGAESVDRFLAELNKTAGLDLQKDLLDHLGPQWVYYNDCTVGGGGFAGTVVINKLGNAELFATGIDNLAANANRIIAREMNEPTIHLEFKSEVVDGVTLHFFAAPLVTPCWAIKDGYLFVGMYPQVVSAAIAQMTDKGPSITERPEFIAVMKRLGDKPAAAVDFVDLPAVAPESYISILGWTRSVLGLSDLFGMTTPAMTVPPLRKMMPQLAPGGSVSWTDAAGWHRKSVSPFPGAMLLAGLGKASVVEADVMTMPAMIPAIFQARRQAMVTKSLSNIHQIGLACWQYAAVNHGHMPGDLGELVPYACGPARVGVNIFLSPESTTVPPENWAAMSDDDRSAWIKGHTDYVYIGDGITPKSLDWKASTTLLAYERLDRARNGKAVLLFFDGHAATLPVGEVQKLIDATKAMAAKNAKVV